MRRVILLGVLAMFGSTFSTARGDDRADSIARGRSLFEHVWTPDDPRSREEMVSVRCSTRSRA